MAELRGGVIEFKPHEIYIGVDKERLDFFEEYCAKSKSENTTFIFNDKEVFSPIYTRHVYFDETISEGVGGQYYE